MTKNDKNTPTKPETQAQWFSRVRLAHRHESTEDYVELIAQIRDSQAEARSSDIAKHMGISCATVSKIISRMKKEGYLENEPYRSLRLSRKGTTLAKKCKKRHEIVLNFLIKLGVPESIAEFDAEGIEHHISKQTLDIFKNY